MGSKSPTDAAGAAKSSPQPSRPDGGDREMLIRLAAYSIFERNGRRLGHALDDWLLAEAEVDASMTPDPPVSPEPVRQGRSRSTTAAKKAR